MFSRGYVKNQTVNFIYLPGELRHDFTVTDDLIDVMYSAFKIFHSHNDRQKLNAKKKKIKSCYFFRTLKFAFAFALV